MLVYLKNDEIKVPQIGIVVSKKIGNAVKRHRMTRLIRNIFTSTVSQGKLYNSPTLLQYIAFEFCNDYQVLDKELREQIEKALK